jgi:diketogulonate reductase-like aldo/keto reductase
MEYRELGRTGVMLPEVGLGTWQYRGGPDLLRAAIDRGAGLVDTAEFYGTEEVVGEALRGRRGKVFVATKTHHWKRDEVLRSAEASLRRLAIETIDLYQLHWPYAAVPIEETMSAMERLVDDGKVRFIGVSNFTVREFKQAQAALARHRIVSNQVPYSIVNRTAETETIPYCEQNGVTVIGYRPLAGGLRKIVQADRGGVLEKTVRETGRTTAQVALNWCLRSPQVVVIPRTDSVSHAIENCGASGWRLTGDQAQALDRGIRFERRGRAAINFRRTVHRALQRVRRRSR